MPKSFLIKKRASSAGGERRSTVPCLEEENAPSHKPCVADALSDEIEASEPLDLIVPRAKGYGVGDGKVPDEKDTSVFSGRGHVALRYRSISDPTGTLLSRNPPVAKLLGEIPPSERHDRAFHNWTSGLRDGLKSPCFHGAMAFPSLDFPIHLPTAAAAGYHGGRATGTSRGGYPGDGDGDERPPAALQVQPPGAGYFSRRLLACKLRGSQRSLGGLGPKRHHCPFCSKSFNDKFDMKRHIRTHTGVRPFKCDRCFRAFTQRCSLEVHQRKVHNVEFNFAFKQRRRKVYVCEACGHSTDDLNAHYSHSARGHRAPRGGLAGASAPPDGRPTRLAQLLTRRAAGALPGGAASAGGPLPAR